MKEVSNKKHISYILGVVGVALLCGGILVYSARYPSDVGSEQIMETAAAQEIIVERAIITEEEATVRAVESAIPSVVSIVVIEESVVRTQTYDPFFNDFFFGFPRMIPQTPEDIETKKRETGNGTGFFVHSEKGLVLTNKHVLSENESAEYSVVTNDGKKFNATVVDRDPVNDLAILKLEDFNGVVPALSFAKSENIKLGQTVIAIGNALGEFSNTVTKGIVSGMGRSVVAGSGNGFSEQLDNVIQTDAAINPGNSGGPLIDLNGDVVGVNTAVSRNGQLIGFAIPSGIVSRAVKSVVEHGEIIRPFLGIRYVMMNEMTAEELNVPYSYGAVIVGSGRIDAPAVVPGGPAYDAGLREHDVILEIDGVKVEEGSSVASILQQYAPGDTVRLRIYSDGFEKTVSAKLGMFADTE